MRISKIVNVTVTPPRMSEESKRRESMLQWSLFVMMELCLDDLVQCRDLLTSLYIAARPELVDTLPIIPREFRSFAADNDRKEIRQ